VSHLPIAALLPDGERLHLHHGPIDLIVGATGPNRDAAYARAAERFRTILADLVAELPGLQRHYEGAAFRDPVAQRMAAAVAPFAVERHVTPMAAVAGSVAEEILAELDGEDIRKAWVNNGGDIAFRLSVGEKLTVLGPAGEIVVRHSDNARGVATSGWRGRSQSLGIADAVTVLARTASAADAAATMIANEVDLPGHPAIQRRPASEVSSQPDLGDRLVTTGVGPLSPDEIAQALDRGARFAATCRDRELIEGAVLALQGETRVV
jgi:ApbE superfamily uncharacterized protein (UPF0280 family)